VNRIQKRHQFLILLLLPFHVLAGQLLSVDKPLTVVTEHLPPYQIVSKDNRISGFSTDLVTEIVKRSGYKLNIQSYSWARSYNLAQKKENTCIYSMARLPVRESLFKWVGALTVTNSVLWGKKNHQPLQLNSLEQAKKHTIAVIKNDATHLALLARGFNEGKNLYIIENTKSLFNLLIARENIDLIVADDVTVGYRAKLAGVSMDKLSRLFEIEDLSLDFHLACSLSTDDKIITKLKSALQSIYQDGFYQKTKQKWQNMMPALIRK